MNHRHETFPAYAALPGVNWSTLREMAKSPLHYQYRCTHPLEDTPQMRLGRIIHTAVLEPDALLHEVVTWEDGVRRGKVWDAFAEANADKTIVSGDEYETALA